MDEIKQCGLGLHMPSMVLINPRTDTPAGLILQESAGGAGEMKSRFRVGCGAIVLIGLFLALAVWGAKPVAADDDGNDDKFQPTVEWTRQFGAFDFDVGRAIGVHETGVYVFGAVSEALPGQAFAGGPDDVYLRKYDFDGNEIWTRQFGTSGDDFPMAGPVPTDDTGVYVAGYVGGLTSGALPGETSAGGYDVFVRKYDHEGNVVWTDQFGSSADDNLDGIATQRGRVVVVGQVIDGALPGQIRGGSWDAFIRMYDRDGNEAWTRQVGGPGSELYLEVATDRTGAYVAGLVSPLPDLGGDNDALVVKYDFQGNLVWTRQFGVSALDRAEGIAVKRDGVYVGGFTTGTFPGQTSAGGQDIFLRKYDRGGNELWTRQFGSSGNDGASFRGVATDGRGVYITGNVAGALPGQTSAGGRDAFVRQYSHGGDELFTLQFGTAGDDRAIAVGVEDDELYLTGRTTGAFAGHVNAGGVDAFVVKILREGDDD